MIARPLELASRLKPVARGSEWLFLVNGGLIVLFFSLFGSSFVLAPGLGVDFRLPAVAGAEAGARAPTHVISVIDAGQVFTGDGLRKMTELPDWLRSQAAASKGRPALLLVQAGVDVPIAVLADIASAARREGYEVLMAASEASAGITRGGR